MKKSKCNNDPVFIKGDFIEEDFIIKCQRPRPAERQDKETYVVMILALVLVVAVMLLITVKLKTMENNLVLLTEHVIAYESNNK